MMHGPSKHRLIDKLLAILICFVFFASCANKDYDRYLQAKIAMAQQPQRVIAEVNGVKIYDQRPADLASPAQQWWIPLLATLITVTGQTILGVSGNNTQADIVRALAAGIGAGSVSNYYSQDTVTGSYNTDSSQRTTDNSVSVRLRNTDQSQHYTDSSTASSYTDASQTTETKTDSTQSYTDNSEQNAYTDASTQTTDTRNTTWY